MAPIVISTDSFAAPLADYFFIAGIDSSRIYERVTGDALPSPSFAEALSDHQQFQNQPPPTSPCTSIPAPVYGERRFTFTSDLRKSTGTVTGMEGRSVFSNRDGATVRQVKDADQPTGNPCLIDADFDRALHKFVSNRDSFLEDIQFSAGQLALPDKPRPRTKTQRISGQGHKRDSSHVDSLRKRLSVMNPLSRQSMSTKRSSNRLSRRISGYNSCIPTPQRFQFQKNMHPVKRSYEPVLLDSYPAHLLDDDLRRRSSFPDHVPMFVFPNDINVVSADDRPKATWHGFVMTNGDGTKLYGMCLITWIALKADAAEDLEHQCEHWRNANMSDEERDMAKDLGSRLASEKARLSELLAILPSLTSGSDERDSHEEEISKVEEKIALIADALRPVRHAAASKIDGLTDGDTGFWIPRAYGVLGRDQSFSGFWKEWLRAVAVPMLGGGVLQVPPSSPRVGIWQPLERYVVNLCTEAPSPMTSITQVELAVRELKLYARKEAVNEIPGSRTTDLYPLFRCLDLQDIVTLMEYVLMESRVIFLSSYTSMLQLACAAITQLLWPLKWVGAFIPVLPARLIQALDAPCPYIMGVERRYERLELPQDDFVLVDLDKGMIESTTPPTPLPQQHRSKLLSILQLAAPHHIRYGVPRGPPKYVTDAFPFDAFPTENRGVFDPIPAKSTLSHLATIDSAAFGTTAVDAAALQPPLFNAFVQRSSGTRNISGDRPSTRSTMLENVPPSPSERFFTGSYMGSMAPKLTRQDSALTLQSSLREKRYGGFSLGHMKRNSTLMVVPSTANRTPNNTEKHKFGFPTSRRPSLPLSSHSYAPSVSTIGRDHRDSSMYAPSVYAQSTMAASTIMPTPVVQPTSNGGNASWAEGHCFEKQIDDNLATCSVCNETGDEATSKCTGCGMTSHSRCNEQICLVCPAAFHSDQVVAAFARCFAGLFYTYRKFVTAASPEEQKTGLVYHFNMDGFLGSVPHHHAEYLAALRDTQLFTSFIDIINSAPPVANPEIQLFDELIAAKRNRSRAHTTTSFFSKPTSFSFSNHNNQRNKKPNPATFSFLADTSDHIWRTASVPSPCSRGVSATSHTSGGPTDDLNLGNNGAAASALGFMGRSPAKLDTALMLEPRVVHGAPRLELSMKRVRRKEVPRLGPLAVGNGNVNLNANANAASDFGSGAGGGGRVGVEVGGDWQE